MNERLFSLVVYMLSAPTHQHLLIYDVYIDASRAVERILERMLVLYMYIYLAINTSNRYISLSRLGLRDRTDSDN